MKLEKLVDVLETTSNLRGAVETCELYMIAKTLTATAGKISSAARLLGITPGGLTAKLKRLRLDARDFDPEVVAGLKKKAPRKPRPIGPEEVTPPQSVEEKSGPAQIIPPVSYPFESVGHDPEWTK
jgi:hypothetical protein